MRLVEKLSIVKPFDDAVIFCALSSQMLWATLARVGNDWLAVPLALWVIVLTIDYYEAPETKRITAGAAVLALALLTKAYLLAFVPVLAAVCVVRKRWRDLGLAVIILAAVAGPWYVRNLRRYHTISGMQEVRDGAQPMKALENLRVERVPAGVESCARAALWTGNNSFRSFSTKTLRLLVASWAAGLLLWIAHRKKRAPEWIVLLYSSAFILALVYDTAINDVASHGQAISPAPWYAQPLLVPMLSLALIGAARGRTAGRWIGALLVLVFTYVLIATYWVKLIPLYSGFEGRTSLSALMSIYGEPSQVTRGLATTCFAPPQLILVTSALVCVLAILHGALLIRAIARIPSKA